MLFPNGLLATSLAFATSAAVHAQTTNFYLVRSIDLSEPCRAAIPHPSVPGQFIPNPNNGMFIGHAPAAVAYGKGRLFVAGACGPGMLPLDGADADGDGDLDEATPFTAAILKIDDALTAPAPSAVPGSRVWVGPGLGYTGLDYAPNVGAVVRGLVATCDTGAGGTNLITRYNVDGPGPVVLAAPAPPLVTGFRVGACGPAWDFGPVGAGVDYLPMGAPDGVPDSPAIAVAELGAHGPYGVHPATLNAGVGFTLYEVGLNNGPQFAPFGEPNRNWRDIDIDPRNGNIAARADNTVVFLTRAAGGSATRADLAPFDPSTQRLYTSIAPNVTSQNIQILHGFTTAGGVADPLIWNDRASTAGGQSFASVVRLSSPTTGAALATAFLEPGGSPAVLPAGNGAYDFYWDAGTRILFIADAAGRAVYLFTPEPPGACCRPDGQCLVLGPTACGAPEVGGVAFAGSTCSPSPCPAPTTGACCSGTACTITTLAGCGGGAEFHGVGTTCGAAGNPTTCCTANFNQTGGVTVQDIFDFLAAYFSGDVRADVNGLDGVSIQDLFIYLVLYFAGCD